jgi:hypothetical protein
VTDPAPDWVLIRDARHPFETIFFAASLLSGISGLILPPSNPALALLLPRWEVLAWNTGMIAGGLLGLAAVAGKFPTSLLIERAALLLFTGLLICQGAAITVLAAFNPSSLLLFGFGAACLVRVVQISRDLTALRRVVRRGAG